MSYRIREVDGGEYADVLTELHEACFDGTAAQPDYDAGHWWLAYDERKEAIGFAGITPSSLDEYTGYLKRAGVLEEHRGHGLQKRLIRVREARAKKNGWLRIVTDCTDNPNSANNLYRAGYRMLRPHYGWAFSDTLYWTKTL